MSSYPFYGENTIDCLSPLITKKKKKKSRHIQWVSVVFGGKVFFISDYCFGPFFRWLKILLVLSGEHKNKKLYNRAECHLNFSATWDKWSSRSLFDVSVADGVFGKPPGWTAMQALRIWEQNLVILFKYLRSFWEIALDLLVGLNKRLNA